MTYQLFQEHNKWIVSITVPYLLFLHKTYEYICYTDEQVRKLVIPFDKVLVHLEAGLSVRPHFHPNLDASWYDCIRVNNKLHDGEIKQYIL